MKTMIAILCLAMVGCGGTEYVEDESEYEINAQLCYAQGGVFKTYLVEDVKTGEQDVIEQCEISQDEDCVPVVCKRAERCPKCL